MDPVFLSGNGSGFQVSLHPDPGHKRKQNSHKIDENFHDGGIRIEEISDPI